VLRVQRHSAPCRRLPSEEKQGGFKLNDYYNSEGKYNSGKKKGKGYKNHKKLVKDYNCEFNRRERAFLAEFNDVDSNMSSNSDTSFDGGKKKKVRDRHARFASMSDARLASARWLMKAKAP
jgi:hypothetical protein